jgi:predicted AlkP superfamily phosphohydrolase/phosphomutase
VVVIGLDGGSWDVLDRLIGAGAMPFLGHLAESGVRANLMSTTPPITPVAWASFATGAGPGRHGVFGFLSQRDDPGSYAPPPVSRRSLELPTLWRRVSDAGRRATVLSVPLTYPPEPVNGFLISGMFTPPTAARSTYPAELRDELSADGSMPKFALDVSVARARGRADERLARSLDDGASVYFDDVNDMTERQRRATLHLMKRPWDLVVSVFVATDRIQHVFWPEIERVGGPREGPVEMRIRDAYRRVDTAVADIVEAAGDDAVVVLMSDHGFGPCPGKFGVGRWLVEAGYAAPRNRRLYRTVRNLLDALGLKGVARHAAGGGAVGRAVRREFLQFDWARTRAYFVPGSYGVRVNLRGREREGIVEPGNECDSLVSELKERLAGILDPAGRGPIFESVARREDVYEGPAVEWAPDLVLRPNPDVGYVPDVGPVTGGPLVRPARKSTGNHRQEGIFLVSGPGVRRRASVAPSIEDVAPTVLRLFGIAPPTEMDGRVLEECFETLPPGVGSSAGATPPVSGDGAYTEEEAEDVRRELESLGYL